MRLYGKIELATGAVVAAPVAFPKPAWVHAIARQLLPANALADPFERVPHCPAEFAGFGWFAYSEVKPPLTFGRLHGAPADAVDMEAETLIRTWPLVWVPRAALNDLIVDRVNQAATSKILGIVNLHQQLNSTARGVELLRAMVEQTATAGEIAEANAIHDTWRDVKAIRAAAGLAISDGLATDEAGAVAAAEAFVAKPAATIIAEAQP